MTREQLINEAVAKALGWKERASAHTNNEIFWVLPDGSCEIPFFLGNWQQIHTFLFPEIEKRGLWYVFTEALVWIGAIGSMCYVEGTADAVKGAYLATPLQICEAFLRAVGAWTIKDGGHQCLSAPTKSGTSTETQR